MRMQFSKIAYATIFGLSLCFAQEQEIPPPDSAPITLAEELSALPPKLSVAQALGSVNLPSGCTGDFVSLLEKEGFDMGRFAKELPQDVAKVKVQMKSPFGKPKDSDMTNSGLTVGCVKALPEAPAELSSLLKDISLKTGLDLAVDATENFVDNSIPSNVSANSGNLVFGLPKPAVISIGLATVGLGAIIYGLVKNSDVAHYVNERNGKAAVDAESSRNIGYGIGFALLAGGLVVYLVF